ncbi:MAG: sodium:calcium antiporter [bacterium]
MKHLDKLIPIFIAVLATVPGIWLRFAGVHLESIPMAFFAGLAILGASFLVLWACDVVQQDVSQALALALVALIAVLPEYSVDMYFTWMAGKYPEGEYSQYAIANMTGANRLLIGIGWVLIVVISWIKTRKAVKLEPERAIELFFLGAATIYAFIIPIKGNLAWYDCIVFIGLFVWYIILASKRPCLECNLEGPAELIGNLPTKRRRIITAIMFLYSAGAIIANAEPFSEGLVGSGKVLGIDEFLLVQWLAPLASEAPEFTVALIFAFRGQPGLALGSLLSAKVNQWTLLVGMIPGVYALSSGQLAHPIPMNVLQMHEILLTAAQSLLGVALLAAFSLSFGSALLLLVLFLGQFIISPWMDSLAAKGLINFTGDKVHQVFSLIYVLISIFIIARKPSNIKRIFRGLKAEPVFYAVPSLEEKLKDQHGNRED